jgi:glycogen phosphorylase
VEMKPTGIDGQFVGELSCDAAGRYGFTVRVVPHHPDLATFAEVGVVTWVDDPGD